jgi:ribosomal protein L16 Arg81 hydroxylase
MPRDAVPLKVGSAPADPFAWLIHPLQRDAFEARYYQREVHVLHRDDPGYYTRLLALEDLDRVLATHLVSHPEVTLVRNDREIQRQEFVLDDGRVDARRAAKLFGEGATIVFTHLHARIPALGGLCASLEQALSSSVQTNVYLTPPRAQGFAPHWDTHDVFVLQVSGVKSWTIYDTKIPLPLRGQHFDRRLHEPGEATLEFDLHPGDFAYIPRGAMHSARSSEQASLHITTGLLMHQWADLLLQGVAAAAVEDAGLRESLPLGWAHPDRGFALSELYAAKVARLVKQLATLPAPFGQLQTELTGASRSPVSGLLRRTLLASELRASSVVRVSPVAGWALHEDGEHCYLRSNGVELRLPSRVLPALRFFDEHTVCSVGTLPNCVDEQGTLVLVRRLINEGFLEPVERDADPSSLAS